MTNRLRAAVRTPARLAATSGVALLLVAGVAYTAVRAATGPEFTSTLVAAHSDQCLTVATGGNGGSLRQRPCDDGPAQRFEFTRVAADTYQLRSVSSGQCVDVRGARRT